LRQSRGGSSVLDGRLHGYGVKINMSINAFWEWEVITKVIEGCSAAKERAG